VERTEFREYAGQAQILGEVVRILEDITRDWDLEFEGGIGPQTHLIADLAFESIDVVQLVVALEERFGRRDLPFQEVLMAEGRYVDDLTVAQLTEFLHAHRAG